MPTLRKYDGSVNLIKEVFDEIKDEFYNAIRENLLLKLEEKIHSCVEDALQKVVAKKNDDIVSQTSIWCGNATAACEITEGAE